MQPFFERQEESNMEPLTISNQIIALKLIAALYARGEINEATYRNAVEKYGKAA